MRSFASLYFVFSYLVAVSWGAILFLRKREGNWIWGREEGRSPVGMGGGRGNSGQCVLYERRMYQKKKERKRMLCL